MDKVYLTILHKRYKYFEGKSITELTDDEIKEYLVLKEEILEAMPEVVESVKNMWETVKEFITPYAEAEVKYRNKIKKSSEGR